MEMDETKRIFELLEELESPIKIASHFIGLVLEKYGYALKIKKNQKTGKKSMEYSAYAQGAYQLYIAGNEFSSIEPEPTVYEYEPRITFTLPDGGKVWVSYNLSESDPKKIAIEVSGTSVNRGIREKYQICLNDKDWHIIDNLLYEVRSLATRRYSNIEFGNCLGADSSDGNYVRYNSPNLIDEIYCISDIKNESINEQVRVWCCDGRDYENADYKVRSNDSEGITNYKGAHFAALEFAKSADTRRIVYEALNTGVQIFSEYPEKLRMLMSMLKDNNPAVSNSISFQVINTWLNEYQLNHNNR